MQSVKKTLKAEFPHMVLRRVMMPGHFCLAKEWVESDPTNAVAILLTARMHRFVSKFIPEAEAHPVDTLCVLWLDTYVFFGPACTQKEVESGLRDLFGQACLECCVCLQEPEHCLLCRGCQSRLCEPCARKCTTPSTLGLRCPVCRATASLPEDRGDQ